MRFFNRVLRSNAVIKLTHWEYWPFGILQAPVIMYWLWLAVRARAFFWFSASNPSILTGGMMGESKSAVLDLIPSHLKPKGFLIKLPANTAEVLSQLQQAGLSFPVIFKPDLGERGWMVRRINSAADVTRYLAEIRIDFIVQELVTLPLEFGVFYLRHPDRANGSVNSITMKEFLSVTGDGRTTLQDLIMAKDRAKLQWDTLQKTYATQLDRVPQAGEKIELVSIGNHCLGTKFINANHLITEKLNSSFDAISKQIRGFYFGRFDLRCASLEDLENGRVMIMELNGCGAEPAHIYHPGFSFWKAMAILLRHFRNMYDISVANHKRGTPYTSLREGMAIYKKFKALKSVQ